MIKTKIAKQRKTNMTVNKNYIGVLQQANTDELAMHYQSITTVFSITSNTGISSSYVTAENKIRESYG